MNIVSDKTNKTYDVFISYYSKTGRDFARCLKAGLEDFGFSVFRDEEDIPKSIIEETEEFRQFIDASFKNSQNFFLIMTVGFNTRPEIIRELKIAFQSQKQKHFFKHEGLDFKDLTVKIDNTLVDLSKYEVVHFTNENDLLRKAIASLFGKIEKKKDPFFIKEAKVRINSEGQDFQKTGEPMIEVVVGSSNPVKDWLLPSKENVHLVAHFSRRCEVTPRRTFFECKTGGRFFLKADTNGFFHFIMPITQGDERYYYVDLIAREMFETIVYVMRIMEFHKFKTPQSILIILRNMGNKEIVFTETLWGHRSYSFTNQPEIEFFFELDTAEGWKSVGQLFLKIFKELCNEMGCIDIEDATIKKRVFNILCYMDDLRTEYRGMVIIPRVEISSFGLP